MTGNGLFDPVDGLVEDLDDEAPLEPAEEAAAVLEATAEADESLDERVEAIAGELALVDRTREGNAVAYVVGGRAFAVLMPDVLEVALDRAVATAALRTADTRASSRGAGWIAFAPRSIDRFALDRAEAWLRSAHRRAAGG